MKRAVIFTAQHTKPATPIFKPQQGDFYIAADGGYEIALQYGITPHLLVGDMDSIKELPEDQETITLPKEKDDTDTHYCAKLALQKGCKEVLIVGGMGGRLDHTIANLHTLALIAEKNHIATATDENATIFMLKSTNIQLKTAMGARISLFPHGGQARGVNITGVDYPLHNATLKGTYPIGVSNVAAGETVNISVKRGFLLVLCDFSTL